MQYHLTKHGDQWRLQEAGSDQTIFTADTKAEAMDKLRDYMEDRDGSVVIHGADGRIQRHRNYPLEPRHDSGISVTTWSVLGVVAVAAVTAAAVVYYYRDAVPVDRISRRLRSRF